MTNNRKTLFIGSVLAVAVLAGIVGPWLFGSDHQIGRASCRERV